MRACCYTIIFVEICAIFGPKIMASHCCTVDNSKQIMSRIWENPRI